MKIYDNYKDSGIEWIGNIPTNWSCTKLKFHTRKIIDGAHFTPTYTEKSEKSIPFLRVTDLHLECIDLDNVKYIPINEHEELIKRCNPEKGDLLLSKNGTIGLMKIIDWDWEFSVFVSLCLIKFEKTLINRFFKYFFDSNIVDRQLFESSQKTSVSNLHLEKIKELRLTLPPIEEQTAIANYLDNKTSQIDHLIAKKEQFIKLLEEEHVAVINQAVTKGLDPNVSMKDSGIEWLGEIPEHWEVPKIWHLIMMKKLEIQDGNHGSLYPKQEDFKTEGVYFIKPRDIRNGAVNFSTCDCLTHEHANSLRIGFSKPNDLLLVNRGGTIGRMARMKTIPNNLDYVLINPQMTYIRCKEDLDSDYAYYQCLSSVFQESLEQVKAYGSTFSFLGLSNMGDFPFVKPPIHEQIDISNFINKKLDEIQSIIYKVNNEIELLKEYKTEVVTGKVDVSTSSTQV